MRRTDVELTGGAAVSFLLLGLIVFAAWATHVIWIIKALASSAGATTGQIALGAIGAFMPPVGVVHGFMIWLGIGL